MRITIVSGFFLPMPPVSGGATEKSWDQLARQFANRGHQVTIISRRWPGLPDDEVAEGIRHRRLPGANHRQSLKLNLLLDFIWSWRVFFALPTADIVVVNTVTLPIWLGLIKPSAGRIVLMTGRMPKGQYRHYRNIARLLAASSEVRDRVANENPRLAPALRIYGYPIDWATLSHEAFPKKVQLPANEHPAVTIGYVGRLHEEKGLRLLLAAVSLLSQTPGLPDWRLLLCGPSEVSQGGSGPDFLAQLRNGLATVMKPGTYELLDPQFDDRSLTEVYRRIGIFCYPSLAEHGETFGVAVVEAMAAGAVPVVSQLACFADYISDGTNGLVFDHRAPDAAARLAAVLSRVLSEPAMLRQLADAARATARNYDFPVYATRLLQDFEQLTEPANQTSSPT